MTGERCCGTRVRGGLYLECGLSPYGQPIEEFIVDPPIVIDPQKWGITNIGVSLVEREVKCRHCDENGIAPNMMQCAICWGKSTVRATHVVDMVGAKYYPNPADIIEEGRVLGFSRRSSLATAKDYARLSSDSRLLLSHRHGSIKNFKDYFESMGGTLKAGFTCPHTLPEHSPAEGVVEEMCAGLYWYDMSPDDVDLGTLRPDTPTRGTRKLPSVTFQAHTRAPHIKPKYEPAIFMSLPIEKIVLVDPDGEYAERAAIAQVAKLPFEIVES